MRPRLLRTAIAGALTAGLTLALGGCAGNGAADVTTLDFFQFKGEALEDFNEIIAAFEAENPDIKVVQNQVGDSETLIRTLLVKNRTPDVITLNANGNFGKLAEAGVFYDFSDEPILDTISPGVQEILADLGNYGDEVNSLGYVNNANGIIYNQDIFEQEGLEVPETWDELIALCDTLEERGITPFATSLAENWTPMPSWNGIGAYYAQDGFFDTMRAEGDTVGPDSPVSFEKDFPEAMERQAELFQYSQDGYRGASYDDSTTLFAQGGAAMMLQGIWALSPVKAVNADINAGIFPYPVPDNPEDRMLVSGVDVTVTMARNTPHKEEALRFIEFMFRPDVIEKFAASQTMVPSVEGAQLSDDPALQSIAPYFDAGKITGFIDHQVPTAIPLTGVVQQYLYDDDVEGALSTLDKEWRKVAARTITTDEEN